MEKRERFSKVSHLRRWVTVLVSLPLVALLISMGGPLLFAVFIGIACILALWEYFRIVFDKKSKAELGLIQLLGFITSPIIIWAAYINSFKTLWVTIILNLMFSALISLQQSKNNSYVSEIMAKQIMGIIYIPLLISHLVLIRNGIDGIIWIYFLLVIVFFGDTGAFYIGSYFGRHKLSPIISPNKTIEGALGGIAANLCGGALFKYFFIPRLPWGLSLLFFLLLGVVGQVGDLFESKLKRNSNIKDSGSLLPGHGGILDRIDALLFAAPLAYLFKEYILLG
ncbi:MAG: phosphatidate cytidylyltransferase [Desulfobacterales bacterium]|nr:MAG: phosphatidate cytidylyltransferase [Desulfobacterales bacterium]